MSQISGFLAQKTHEVKRDFRCRPQKGMLAAEDCLSVSNISRTFLAQVTLLRLSEKYFRRPARDFAGDFAWPAGGSLRNAV
jgi:hypothetical protein